MMIRPIQDNEKELFNSLAPHILQTTFWGEFLQTTGKKVIYLLEDTPTSKQSYLISFTKIPFLKGEIAYLQKSAIPSKEVTEYILKTFPKSVFMKCEPQATLTDEHRKQLQTLGWRKSIWRIFIENTFFIDLTRPIEEIQQHFEGNIKRNIKKAQKHGITIENRTDSEAIDIFLSLNEDTTKRKVYFTHSNTYYKKMWEQMREKHGAILFAKYQDAYIGAVVLFFHNNILYNPYAASKKISTQTGAMAFAHFAAIQLGKELGCHTYDMWGCLGKNPDPKNPLYGVHTFKQGFKGELITFVGSYDYVQKPLRYYTFQAIAYLRARYYYIIKKLKLRS